jgi:hypothetical protein
MINRITEQRFISAIINREKDKMLNIIENGEIKPNYSDNYALKYSCIAGYTDIVHFLLNNYYPLVDPSTGNNYCIKAAVEYNNYNIIKILLKYPEVDPTIDYNYPIITASRNRRYKIVNLLLSDKRVLNTIGLYGNINATIKSVFIKKFNLNLESNLNNYNKVEKLLKFIACNDRL